MLPPASGNNYDGTVHRVTIASRPLSHREQQVLRYLLAFDPAPEDAAAHHSFLGQIEFARVTGRCDCGCATVDLSVDRAQATGALQRTEEYAYAEAQHLTEPRDLLLFVKDGWLSSIEVVDHDEVHSPELPHPSAFGAAHSAWRTS